MDQKKFQELQLKAQKVVEGAIKLNTQVEGAQENYQKVKEIALKKYETADIKALEDLANNWERQNEENYAAAEARLAAIVKEKEEKTNLMNRIQQLS